MRKFIKFRKIRCSIKLTVLILAVIMGGFVTEAIAEKSEKQIPQLLIDLDFFDNIVDAKVRFGKDFYGPKEIAEFFKNCKKSGVNIVYWRAMCQVANYPSKLNYNINQLNDIPSKADSRRISGAYSAKIGVGNKKVKSKIFKKLNAGIIYQKVKVSNKSNFCLSAQIIAPQPGVSLVIYNKKGKLIKKSKIVISPKNFSAAKINFSANGTFYVGVSSPNGNNSPFTFIVDDILLKDNNDKQYLLNGSMEKHFMLRPINWKTSGTDFLVLNGDYKASGDNKADYVYKIVHQPGRSELYRKTMTSCNTLAEAVKQAHLNGVKIYAWLDPVDDGMRVIPPEKTYSSRFMETHPEFRALDKNGRRRWGLLCFGYPEVRKHKTEVIKELLSYDVDGIVLKMSYPHNMIWDGRDYNYKTFLYNDVALKKYSKIWGTPKNSDYDEYRLRIIYGNFFVQWLREIRPLFKKSGKRLSYFSRPGKYLYKTCAAWKVSIETLIKEKLIDDLLLEPRHSGDNIEKIKEIQKQTNYIDLCHQYGVKVGYDFHLGRLLNSSVSDKHEYFRKQLTGLINEKINFVGVYEGMYVEHFNYWPDLKYIHDILKKHKGWTTKNQHLGNIPKTSKNLALFEKGCTAAIKWGKKTLKVVELIDGERANESAVTISRIPATLQVKFPAKTIINCIKIFPGHLAQAKYPSGICGIKAYKITGFRKNKKVKTLVKVSNADERIINGRVCLTHKFPPVAIDEFRIEILKSSDTGCRVFSPKKAVVPLGARVSYIREIEAYNLTK